MDVFLTGFPKKLLVAISLVAVIAMCLIPAEARTLEHRIRHERRQQESLTQPTKDSGKMTEQKKRAHRKQSVNLMHTKEMAGTVKIQKNSITERLKKATKKIKQKLINTKRYLSIDSKVLNETKEFRDGMPTWLPTINFVDIHFYNYKTKSHKGTSLMERKFMFTTSKLYKSLLEYEEIFEHLLNVEVDIPDDPFLVYNKTRHTLIWKTLDRLRSTIAEVKENIEDVNMPVPQFNLKLNLSKLEKKVDAIDCLKNDYIAFRAYSNLLNNWSLEYKCPKGKKVIKNNKTHRICLNYETKLKEKRDSRIPKEKVSKITMS